MIRDNLRATRQVEKFRPALTNIDQPPRQLSVPIAFAIALQAVVAGAADQRVVLRSADETIIAAAAEHEVAACAAVERIGRAWIVADGGGIVEVAVERIVACLAVEIIPYARPGSVAGSLA